MCPPPVRTDGENQRKPDAERTYESRTRYARFTSAIALAAAALGLALGLLHACTVTWSKIGSSRTSHVWNVERTKSSEYRVRREARGFLERKINPDPSFDVSLVLTADVFRPDWKTKGTFLYRLHHRFASPGSELTSWAYRVELQTDPFIIAWTSGRAPSDFQPKEIADIIAVIHKELGTTHLATPAPLDRYPATIAAWSNRDGCAISLPLTVFAVGICVLSAFIMRWIGWSLRQNERSERLQDGLCAWCEHPIPDGFCTECGTEFRDEINN